MATATPSRPAPPEIEHLFQASLFLLIATGFATLASTGKLDLISVVFVAAALVLRAFLIVRDHPFVIPRRVTAWLAFIYILLYFVDFFFFSNRDFVTPSVHLVLFGMCVKLYNVERDRDYVYLAVLSFLMVLSAAILTVDSAFLASFGLFILLAVFCFMAMELRRSAISATNTAPIISPVSRTRRSATAFQRLSSSLVRTTVALVAAIIATATLLFFAMPRISGGYLSRYAQSDAISTGFSDSVNLGEIGRIQQSTDVVAHVRIEGDTAGDHEIRLRGAVLTNFDGKRWTNPHRDADVLSQGYGRVFQLAARSSRLQRSEVNRIARGPQMVPVRYRVLMEPLNTNVIFTIPAAQALFGAFRELGVDDEQTFHNLDHDRNVTIYQGVSDVSTPLPTALEHPSATMPIGLPSRYLQLPDRLDPRIPVLAHQVAGSKPSPYLQAFAIERYLSTRFGYTLQLPSETPADPIADFLFHRRRGHCEYFASSMAVLLRTIGIPSRVITGFRGGQFNQINANYIVRASDAHSWVEAYIPGAGWMTFDPTPAGDAPAATFWTRAQLYLDAAREFWREWVVNYDAGHQQALSAAGVQQTRSQFFEFRHWASHQYRRMLEVARAVHRAATHNPISLLRPGLILLAVLLLIASPLTTRHMQNLWQASTPSTSPRTAASVLYMRMNRRLARRGYPRAPAQTPVEFAASISEPALREAVVRFTSAYEQARFGGSPDAASTLPALLDQIRNTPAST